MKFEGKWVYALIIPALFMATVVVLGLVPDIAFHQNTVHDTPALVETAAEPVSPTAEPSAPES